jgi:hypothetical protein
MKRHIVGRPGYRTAAAMSKGRMMTAERLQKANEAARLGKAPQKVKDRPGTHNALAARIQAMNEAARAKEGK